MMMLIFCVTVTNVTGKETSELTLKIMKVVIAVAIATMYEQIVWKPDFVYIECGSYLNFLTSAYYNRKLII